MWAFIAFVSSNILWLLIGVFIGGAMHGYEEIKNKEKKENDEPEISST
jgi:uncharacterized membrane protein YraQ (UPF0718 family)